MNVLSNAIKVGDQSESAEPAEPAEPTSKRAPMKFTLEALKAMPRFDRSVSLLCWAYNEEEIIEDYLLRANRIMQDCVEDYEIVVVDDCSTDRTNDIVRSLQRTMPRIRLLRNQVNMNVGPSSWKAIQSATKDFVFWQTLDWSYDITHLRGFLELLKTYDVVVGVRRAAVDMPRGFRFLAPIAGLIKMLRLEHLKRRSDNLIKAVVSVGNYLIIRLFFRVPVSDVQNIHFYPRELLQSLDFESRSSFGGSEYIFKSYWLGRSIVEVPIPFIPRTKGEVRAPGFKSVARAFRDILWLWFLWVIRGKRKFVKKGTIHRLDRTLWKLPPGF